MTSRRWTKAIAQAMPAAFWPAAAAAAAGLGLCAVAAYSQTTAPPAATTPAQTSPDDNPSRLGDTLLGHDQPPEVRLSAATRLAALRNPVAAVILTQALESTDASANSAAAKALAQANWADRQFAAPLENLLGPSAALNADAASVLIQFAPDADVAAHLLTAAQNPTNTPAARAPVVRALGSFGVKDVASALVDLVQNPDESDEVRQASALALAEMSGQNSLGQDPRKWVAWWQQVKQLTPADFAQQLQRQRADRMPQVLGQADRLQRGLNRLLTSLYFTSQPADQSRILDSYLTNDAPEIRAIGAQIVEIDGGGGKPMTDPVRQRLIALMQSDLAPSVRAAAAGALGLDPNITALLLAQLAKESEADVQVALLGALSSRQNPTAISQAVALLKSPSPLVAQSAADLLAAAGSIFRDPSQAALRQQVETALLQALDTGGDSAPAQPPAVDPLRRSVVTALAALGDLNLYDRFMRLASASEPTNVRVAAIGGLGFLARLNTDIAGALADFVDTQGTPPALRLKAVQELAGVNTTAYVDRLVDRLNRSPEPLADIRAAIWQTVMSWLPDMGDDRMVALAERLKNESDYPREVDVRRYYVSQLQSRKTNDAQQAAASQLETIATRELENLNQPALAAADFANVCGYYESKSATPDDLPHNPFRAEAAALLAAGPPYDASVKFAADTLSDPERSAVIPDVLEQFPRFANALATSDPNNRDSLGKSLSLVKTFTDAKLNIPASLSYVTDNLQTAAQTAQQNLTNLPAAPAP